MLGAFSKEVGLYELGRAKGVAEDVNPIILRPVTFSSRVEIEFSVNSVKDIVYGKGGSLDARSGLEEVALSHS
jgi:hypothetical protein